MSVSGLRHSEPAPSPKCSRSPFQVLPTAANDLFEGHLEAIPHPLGAIRPGGLQDLQRVDVAYYGVVDHHPLPLRVSDFRLYGIELRFNQRYLGNRTPQPPMYSLMKELPKVSQHSLHRDDPIL
jgi:hypothetical protein